MTYTEQQSDKRLGTKKEQSLRNEWDRNKKCLTLM